MGQNLRMYFSSIIFGILILDTTVVAPLKQFSTSLDDSSLHTLYWIIDYDSQLIIMELHSKISSGSWIALGFSNRGGIKQADFCMIWTDLQNNTSIQDIWTDENGTIHVDDQQDCLYKGFKHDNGEVTVSVFSRKFDSCDVHDYIIEEGTMRVVWAAGRSSAASAEGLDMSAAVQHGSVSTRLLRPLEDDPPLPTDTWTLDVTQHNFKVPKVDSYWCKVVQVPDKFKKKHHIVKWEMVLTPGNEHLIHHIILKQCDVPIKEGLCHPMTEGTCLRFLAAAPPDFSFPEEAGFALGGTNLPIYLLLEVHYTPPDNSKDWVDSSGIRLHVTPNLRRYDASAMELGLGYTAEIALPPGLNRFPVSSHCVGPCTAVSLPPEGITAFASRIHSHKEAAVFVVRHVRGGKELPEIVRENHYDVHNQPMWRHLRNTKILPGDALITTCVFNTTDNSNVTLTGFGTSDEMCTDTLFYYPKTELILCKSVITDQSLVEYFHKTNGKSSVDTEDYSVLRNIKNYRKIKWTSKRVESLLDLYSRSRIDAKCIWNIKGPAQGNWHNLTLEPVQNSLPPTSRHCPEFGVYTKKPKGI